MDIQTATISPDPTNDPKDNAFISLVALKTAYLILSGEAKQYSVTSGVSIQDGPSSINVTGVFKNVKELAKDMQEQYFRARMEFRLSQSPGHVVSTPVTYINNNYGTGYNSTLNPRSDYGNIY